MATDGAKRLVLKKVPPALPTLCSRQKDQLLPDTEAISPITGFCVEFMYK